MISGLVLAAGASRRMGQRNKLLLPCKGEPIVRRTAFTVLASRVSEVIVVTGHDHKAIAQALVGLPLRLAYNPNYTRGISSSVACGVRSAAAEASAFMVCLADLVMLTAQDLDFLIEAFEAQQQTNPGAIVRPVYHTTPGHPVLWPASYRDVLCNACTREDSQRPIERFAQNLIYVHVQNERYVRDVDTEEDYAAQMAGHGKQ